MHLRQACLPALSVLALLASGCRESLSPLSIEGTFVLERVGEAPVPAVIFTDSRGTVRVIADTLVLNANGQGRFVTVQTIEATGGPGPGTPTRIESALFHWIMRPRTGLHPVSTSRVALTYACPIGASCIHGPHLLARRQEPWLIVEETLAIEAPRYYRRIDEMSKRSSSVPR